MSLFVLDTDMLSLYQDGDPAVCRECASHTPADLAISIITVEEQVSGWYTRLRRARQREELARVYQRFTDFIGFVSRLRVLTFSEPAIIRYEALKTLKLNIGKKDL